MRRWILAGASKHPRKLGLCTAKSPLHDHNRMFAQNRSQHRNGRLQCSARLR